MAKRKIENSNRKLNFVINFDIINQIITKIQKNPTDTKKNKSYLFRTIVVNDTNE